METNASKINDVARYEVKAYKIMSLDIQIKFEGFRSLFRLDKIQVF